MGACGLEERCCTAYLSDFSPISIKMAKEQGISLTPTEITGMCGRLRCCLAYEFDQYTEARKSLPKKNKRVLTPHGEGKVLDVYPLKGAVLVLLDNEVLHEYLDHEIQLFDENGVPLPRITGQDSIGTLEDEEENHIEESELARVPPEEALPPEGEKPIQQVSTTNAQKSSGRKVFRGHSPRGQYPDMHEQKPTQISATHPSDSKKYKPGSHQKQKPGVNQQTTGNRPMKGHQAPNQRRNRDRK
jgi:hypothetical protein